MFNIGNKKEEVIFADMSRVEPKSAISKDFQRYTWRMVEYETDEFSGKMLVASPESEVPEVTLSLNLKGWHAIYLGLRTEEMGINCGISIRLSGDEATSYVTADKAGHLPQSFEEAYWKCADLTGQKFVFKHPEGGWPTVSYALYVKCVPLSGNEIEKLTKDRECRGFKRLIGMNDMDGFLWMKRPVSLEPFLEELEPYRDTDFERVDLEYWGGGNDAEYWDHKGLLLGNGIIYMYQGTKNGSEARRILKSKGIDFYSHMIEYTKKMGLKVYLSQRMNAFAGEIPFDTEYTSAFYTDFPQFRCKDKDGSEIARMSLAYREVQDNFLQTFRKMASYSPDGISLLFNRGMPFMLYEEPLVSGFIEKYGEDPRKLDEDDKRWLEYKSGIMTGFIERLREEMDECAHKQGMDRINISVHVLANEEQNRKFGLDIGRWAQDGLADAVVAYPIAILAPNIKTLSAGNVIDIDVDYYTEIVKGTGCKIYIDMLPREMEPEEYRQKAIEYYAKGVDGLCFWDSNSRYIKPRKWSMICRLGHKEELTDMDSGDGTYYRKINVKSLGGLRVDRYPPVWGL